MLSARSMHSLVYADGIVYAIAGCSEFDESSSLRSCEYYNISQNNWFEMPPCHFKSSGSGLAMMNNSVIYKFGGKDGPVKAVNEIERYLIKKRVWEKVDFNLNLSYIRTLPFFPIAK